MVQPLPRPFQVVDRHADDNSDSELQVRPIQEPVRPVPRPLPKPTRPVRKRNKVLKVVKPRGSVADFMQKSEQNAKDEQTELLVEKTFKDLFSDEPNVRMEAKAELSDVFKDKVKALPNTGRPSHMRKGATNPPRIRLRLALQ